MTAIAIAIGALLIAALEVVALVAIVLTLAAVTYGVVLGIRRSRPTSTTRLGAVGVPRQLGERRHGSRIAGGMLGFAREAGTTRGYEPTLVIFDEAAAFDGHAIGERLDHDIEPGCDR